MLVLRFEHRPPVDRLPRGGLVFAVSAMLSASGRQAERTVFELIRQHRRRVYHPSEASQTVQHRRSAWCVSTTVRSEIFGRLTKRSKAWGRYGTGAIKMLYQKADEYCRRAIRLASQVLRLYGWGVWGVLPQIQPRAIENRSNEQTVYLSPHRRHANNGNSGMLSRLALRPLNNNS